MQWQNIQKYKILQQEQTIMNKTKVNDSTRHYIAFLSRKYADATQVSQREVVFNHVLLNSNGTATFIAEDKADKNAIKWEIDT